jgi:hypothetical protein
VITRLAIVLLCALAGAIALMWVLYAAVTGGPRFWPLARAFDRVGNVAIGGNDDKLITERAAIGAALGRRRWCLLCRLLDRVDPGHCERAN